MTPKISIVRAGLLAAALAALLPISASAQDMDHSHMSMPMNMPMPGMDMPKPAKPAAKKPKPQAVQPQAAPKKKKQAKPAAASPHHTNHPSGASPQPTSPPMDHAAMGHDMSSMQGMDMQNMDMQGMDMSQMNHAGMSMAPTEPRTPIPPLTDADRAAAQPPSMHMEHLDNGIHSYTLIDRLEGWNASPGKGLGWEGQGWVGTDLNRLWWRSEGERVDGRTEAADLEVLYGKSFSRWWDVVAGVRHDFGPGPAQDFAAIGVMGLAPQKFEVAATGYIGSGGQTSLRLETEYETLLTNRLILQPRIEIDAFGRDDPRRGIGSGLSTAEAGLRLRYEFTRQFAPYIGVVREWSFGNTADFRRDDGEAVNDTRLVAGLRIWF